MCVCYAEGRQKDKKEKSDTSGKTWSENSSTALSLICHFPLQFHIMLACYLLTLGYSSSATSCCGLSQVTL